MIITNGETVEVADAKHVSSGYPIALSLLIIISARHSFSMCQMII